MKHLKTFEITVTTRLVDKIEDDMSTDTPQKGDYVICQERMLKNSTINDFLQNNIGQIAIILNNEKEYKYKVRYKNVPEELHYYFATGVDEFFRVQMRRDEILYFSANRADMQLILKAKKYNI